MGKYDALFADESDDEAPPAFLNKDTAKGGKYAALFEEPPATTETRPFSASAQNYAANVEDLKHVPLPPTSVTGNLALMGRTIAGGAKALGRLGYEEAKSLPGSFASVVTGGPKTDYLTTNPAARRELERGVSDTVTAGLAEKAARAVDPEAFSREQAATDAQAAPGVRVGGGLAGAFLPSPAKFVASKLPGTTGFLPNVGRGIAQYEATVPVSAAIQAEPGESGAAFVDAATNPAAIVAAGGLGGAGTIVPAAKKLLQKKAEDRMVDQAMKDIAGSKETGLSKPTDRRQIAKMAEPIKEEFRDPANLKIADTARSDPAQAWEMVQKKVDAIGAERPASYAAVDAETGGARISELRRFLQAEVDRLAKAPGNATERQAVDNMIKDIDTSWGQQLAPTVPTKDLRAYVTKLQRVAADTMGTLEETRRVQILDHVSGLAKKFLDDHLDAAAASDPGLRPVVDGLREQNRRVAAWLSMEDALKTRASKIETNRLVDNKLKILGTGAAAAAGAAHFLHSPGAAALAGGAAVAPYVLPPIDRALTRGLAGMTPGMQVNAPAVARLIQAAHNGASRPDLRAQAEQDGVPVEIADNIAQQNGR